MKGPKEPEIKRTSKRHVLRQSQRTETERFDVVVLMFFRGDKETRPVGTSHYTGSISIVFEVRRKLIQLVFLYKTPEAYRVFAR